MIQFANADVSVALRYRATLKEILAGLFKKEATKLTSLQYVFCSDEYLLAINREFLSHDYYTDIITFQLGDHPDTEGVEGEIYISVDRVRENARIASGFNPDRSLLRVIFHGALHLCGYRDKTRAQQEDDAGKGRMPI